MEGQKTGLYLDQLDNYARVARYAKGRRVLDCFTQFVRGKSTGVVHRQNPYATYLSAPRCAAAREMGDSFRKTPAGATERLSAIECLPHARRGAAWTRDIGVTS